MAIAGNAHVLDGRRDAAAVCESAPCDRVRRLEDQVANLQLALLSQRQIGTVIGLLAQRFGFTTEQAWRVLVRLSQNTNIKVRVAARVLAEAFDGRVSDEDAPLLAELAAQLPVSGWPRRVRQRDD